MVVCICNNVSHNKVIEMAKSGCCIDTLIEATAVTTCCGCCKEMIFKMHSENFIEKENKDVFIS